MLATHISMACMPRLNACDGQSKHVQHLYNASFVPLNQTHHVPILGTIRKTHMAYHKDRTVRACNFAQRIQCRQAQLQDTSPWQQLQDHLHKVISVRQQETTHAHDAIQLLHQQIIPKFQELFKGSTNPIPKIDYTDFHHAMQEKWQHHQFLKHSRNCPHTTLQHIWKVWHHWSRFSFLRRTQQKRARLARSATRSAGQRTDMMHIRCFPSSTSFHPANP